jgi:hypothetical protein
LLLLGCGSSAPPDGKLPADARWLSEHFDYRTRAADTTTCADVTTTLEEHFSTLNHYLGFTWPAGQRIVYYKFLDSDDFDANSDCPLEAGGCAKPATVNSPTPLDEHELVHAYLYPTGFPPWILVEGAATALSCTARHYEDPKPDLAWDQLAGVAAPTVDPVSVYRAGSWLFGYLLDVFGPGPFMTLYGTLAHNASAADMDAAFRQIYGEDLATIWAAAIGEDRPRNTCLWECSRPPIVLDGSTIDTAGTCGAEIYRPFTLGSDATVAFSISGASFTIGPCGPNRVPAGGLNGNLPGGMLALFRLASGSYFIEHNPIAGSITTSGDAFASLASTCAAATDEAGLDRPNVYAAVPASSTPWYVPRPRSSTSAALQVQADPGASASICASCDASSCADPSQAGAWASGQVVKLTTNPSRAFSEFLLFR